MALAAGLLAGCGDGEVANSSGGSPATLSFSGTNGTAPLNTAMSTGGPQPLVTLPNQVTLDTFRFAVREIELEADMDVEEDSEVEFHGQYIVDLLAGTVTDADTGGTTSKLSEFLPPGTYEEVEFELTPLAGVDTLNPSAPLALLATGSYTSASAPGENRTFQIVVSVPFEVEIEGPDGIVIDGLSNDLVVQLQVDQIFSVANLDALITALGTESVPGSGDYQVLVTPDTDPAQIAAFRDLLEQSMEFGEDDDGDHHLDDDEDVDHEEDHEGDDDPVS